MPITAANTGLQTISISKSVAHSHLSLKPSCFKVNKHQLCPHLYSFVLVDAQAVHQAKDLLAVLAQTGPSLSRQWLLVEDRSLDWNVQSHPLVLFNLGHGQALWWIQDQHPADQVLTVCQGVERHKIYTEIVELFFVNFINSIHRRLTAKKQSTFVSKQALQLFLLFPSTFPGQVIRPHTDTIPTSPSWVLCSSTAAPWIFFNTRNWFQRESPTESGSLKSFSAVTRNSGYFVTSHHMRWCGSVPAIKDITTWQQTCRQNLGPGRSSGRTNYSSG